MFSLFTREGTGLGSRKAGRRRSRRAAIEVAPLEGRWLLSTASPITVTESVTPLAAARGRSVHVQVSGTVTDSDTAAVLNPSLAYAVFNSRTNSEIGSGTARSPATGAISSTSGYLGGATRARMISRSSSWPATMPATPAPIPRQWPPPRECTVLAVAAFASRPLTNASRAPTHWISAARARGNRIPSLSTAAMTPSP
jgi:hypothetical protein